MIDNILSQFSMLVYSNDRNVFMDEGGRFFRNASHIINMQNPLTILRFLCIIYS